jgi:hypothetical protein
MSKSKLSLIERGEIALDSRSDIVAFSQRAANLTLGVGQAAGTGARQRGR